MRRRPIFSLLTISYVAQLAAMVLFLQVVMGSDEKYRSYEKYPAAQKEPEYFDEEPLVPTDAKVAIKQEDVDMDNSTLVKSFNAPGEEEDAYVDGLEERSGGFDVEFEDGAEKLTFSAADEILEQQKMRKKEARTKFNPDRYYSYYEMLDYLGSIQGIMNPDLRQHLAIIESIGTSYENRPMYVVKISSDHFARRPIVFVEAGIHAREWASPAVALNLINQLVTNYSSYQPLLQNVDVYVVPVVNPDGYEYSRKVDRMWTKTRSYRRGAWGVGTNLNFDFHWNEKGTSDDTESDFYAGPYPFSEVEIRNLRDVVNLYKDRISTYIAIHISYKCIAIPYNYKKSAIPPLGTTMDLMAFGAANAIEYATGSHYRIGSAARLMYESSGGSIDYFKGVTGIDYTFHLALASGSKPSFMTPTHDLRKLCLEGLVAIRRLGELTVTHLTSETDEMLD